jgi:hypothetical protein
LITAALVKESRMSLAIFLRKRMANLRRIYVATFHRKHLAVYRPPPNSHALGDDPDLNTLANAAEQLFVRDD